MQMKKYVKQSVAAGRIVLACVLAVVLIGVLMVTQRYWRYTHATEPLLMEFVNEAIPSWRSHSSPSVLVLLSADPFLEPVSAEDGVAAEQLFKTGNQAEIARQVGFSISDPALLPTQTVRMALRCGIVSGLTWIVPQSSSKEQAVSYEALRAWLVTQSMLSEQEKASLKVENDAIVGTVEGRPFRLCVLDDFRGGTGSHQLHIDLSYFKAMYRNEIKTPLYQLVQSSLDQLFAHSTVNPGVTISHSTANGDVPLTLRFLGRTLKGIFDDRSILTHDLSPEWLRRRDMLYLVEFHQVDKMVELAKSNVAVMPNDGSAYFDLYRAYHLQKDLPRAEAALGRACDLDPGYVYEYRNLAVQALDFEDAAAAVANLRQALQRDPENVFYKLDLARVLLVAGDKEGALVLLRELEALPWSKVYYPQMPRVLVALGTSPLPSALPSPVKQPADHPQ